MNYLDSLIEQHASKGVLLDTNLSLVYIVGSQNPKKLKDCKRTEGYSEGDFLLLQHFIKKFRCVVTTPHVLAEVSSLLGVSISGTWYSQCYQLFARWIEKAKEESKSALSLTNHNVFLKLGITDAALFEVASGGPLLLTVDFDLCGALEARKIHAVNFNHIRQIAWGGSLR